MKNEDFSDLSVSFSGCAWFITYHLGVYKVLQNELNLSRATFLGASSGAMVAAVAACDVSAEKVYNHVIEAARDSFRSTLGPLGKMSQILENGLDILTPQVVPDLSRRLQISVTEFPSLRNRLLAGPIRCKAQLKKLICASSYIPLYYEKPVEIGGRYYVDGGLTENLPVLNDNTICVQPYRSSKKNRFHIALQIRQRPIDAFFPKLKVLNDLYYQGQMDAIKFLGDFRKLA